MQIEPGKQGTVVGKHHHGVDVAIERLDVAAYRIPTDAPESDGTLEWDSTPLVVAEAPGGGAHGLGYTYADTATARLIQDRLAEVVVGRDATAMLHP